MQCFRHAFLDMYLYYVSIVCQRCYYCFCSGTTVGLFCAIPTSRFAVSIQNQIIYIFLIYLRRRFVIEENISRWLG